MRKLRSLPRPDDFGNYWFGEMRNGIREEGPAILPVLAIPRYKGWFMLSLGPDGGVVTKNGSVRLFETPQLALDELQRRMKCR